MGRKRLLTSDPERDGPLEHHPHLDAQHSELFEGRATPAPDRPGRPRSPVPRILCMLLVDLSGSMVASGAIMALLVSLRKFREAVLKNSLLTRMLEWAVVGFADTPRVLSPYAPITDWTAPAELEGGSGTAMGTAVLTSISLQAEHTQKLASRGIGTQHSLVVILTDGEPTGEPEGRFEEAARAIKEAEKNRFTFLPIVVQGGNIPKLQSLTPHRAPLGLDRVDYDTFFNWLLGSIVQASISQPGQRIELADPIKSPENPKGWASF
jgi:uncharacterized protein YegL